MSDCPECKKKLRLLDVMSLGGWAPVECKGCGIYLKVNNKTKAFNILLTILGAIIGAKLGGTVANNPTSIVIWASIILLLSVCVLLPPYYIKPIKST